MAFKRLTVTLVYVEVMTCLMCITSAHPTHFKPKTDTLGVDNTPKCTYDGATLQGGATFHPDNCTTCHCPRHGGRALCFVQDCLFESNCIRNERPPGSCCGVCVEYGCRHTDGSVYKLGQVVVDTPCEKCVCPVQGGYTMCTLKQECPPANCVDAEWQEGSCCPSCPNGKERK